MKKLLKILAVFSLTIVSTINIVACNNNYTNGVFKEITNWDKNNGFINKLATINNNLYVTTWNGKDEGNLYKSNDDSFALIANWDKSNGAIRSLLNVNSTIYLGTNKGNLYKSNDDGSFSLVSNWNKDDNHIIYCLTVTDDGTIYVGTWTSEKEGNLYKSNDDGSFSLVSNWNKNNGEINALVIINNNLYVGTNKGLYYSTDKVNTNFIQISEINGEVKHITIINDIIYIISDSENAKLFEITNNGIVIKLDTNFENQGTVRDVLAINNNLYVGTGGIDGKLLKITRNGTLLPVIGWNNNSIYTLASINNYLYIGTGDTYTDENNDKIYSKIYKYKLSL